MTRCPSCLARIARNSGVGTKADWAAASNDCTCDPINNPGTHSRFNDQDIDPPRLRPPASVDPGWRDDHDANGYWSNVVRALEDD